MSFWFGNLDTENPNLNSKCDLKSSYNSSKVLKLYNSLIVSFMTAVIEPKFITVPYSTTITGSGTTRIFLPGELHDL